MAPLFECVMCFRSAMARDGGNNWYCSHHYRGTKEQSDMSDKPRSDHSDRDKRDRIERLKRRLDDAMLAQVGEPRNPLVPILKGILDLLADEL